MKSNRKLYILPELNNNLNDRLKHIDNGISDDELIPEGVSFNVNYNRDVIKKIKRFEDFLAQSSNEEISNYFKTHDEIKSLDLKYQNLKSYTPSDSYFSLIFYESKGFLKDYEYKLLYLLPKDKDFNFDYKQDISKCVELKDEYIPTEAQRRIANFPRYNVVIGAAGTGKTDVAIHSYINAIPLNNIKSSTIRDDVLITYSKKLSDYVTYILDIFWNDYKNPIKKNVYTTTDFFIQVLADSNINIDGYNIKDNKYYKNNSKELLNDNIADLKTYNNWCESGFVNMNKALAPNLNSIIEKYGIDYPYLFYRGIYKGKIINKVSDSEILDHFVNEYKFSENEFISTRRLLDNYIENCDEIADYDEFKAWYKESFKRYSNDFKLIPQRFKEVDDLNKLLFDYFDFVNPIRQSKKYIDYFDLFKREALLIEGYRGQTRKDFDDEIKVLYEMCNAYQKYLESNNLYDDNDLAYLVTNNLDKILSKGIFNNIIVDEFQDMTERQIDLIVKLTYDENSNGVCHIFGDFEQTINPTFLQMEHIETIYLVNDIDNYEKQILSSSFRYSRAICKELEALRELGKKIFGTEDVKTYVPLVSNVSKEFETNGNLLLDINKGNDIVKDVIKAKNVNNVMFIVADFKAKLELINNFKCNPDKVFTVSESKGREEDFVIVYKLCSSKSEEYENLFSDDMSYSRAGRIFYNQLYVGITRCKINFLQIEDESLIGPKTKEALTNVIALLEDDNVALFKEELLSQKANFYFRAIDSLKNLDFNAVKDNLSFYSGDDILNIRPLIKLIDDQVNGIDSKIELYKYANNYKAKKRYDLARVIYIVLDNNDMNIMLNIRENINTDIYTDNDIR
ncbi:MAG: UvrD-helicase domain-containing protein, partial [Acholeplasmatales bacterium]|nr:UvrD-helicase domain-containing protein [Acholeplasmatales bacterium]